MNKLKNLITDYIEKAIDGYINNDDPDLPLLLGGMCIVAVTGIVIVSLL